MGKQQDKRNKDAIAAIFMVSGYDFSVLWDIPIENSLLHTPYQIILEDDAMPVDPLIKRLTQLKNHVIGMMAIGKKSEKANEIG